MGGKNKEMQRTWKGIPPGGLGELDDWGPLHFERPGDFVASQAVSGSGSRGEARLN